MVQVAGVLPPMWETWTESWLLVLVWSSPSCHGHLGSELIQMGPPYVFLPCKLKATSDHDVVSFLCTDGLITHWSVKDFRVFCHSEYWSVASFPCNASVGLMSEQCQASSSVSSSAFSQGLPRILLCSLHS